MVYTNSEVPDMGSDLIQKIEDAVDLLVGRFSRKMGTPVSASIIRENIQWLVDQNGTRILDDEDSLFVGVQARLDNRNNG